MLLSLERLELPRLAEGIERARLSPDELMIRSPQPPGAAGYLRLEPADQRLLDMMDGSRTPAEILVENFRAGGGLAIARLNRLLVALKAGRFLVPPRVDVYAALERSLRRNEKRSLFQRLGVSSPLDLLSLHLITWRSADGSSSGYTGLAAGCSSSRGSSSLLRWRGSLDWVSSPQKSWATGTTSSRRSTRTFSGW
jgi:hypothetical protein